jgi:eukaryotic-like serine/threonine-protein kinase
VLTEKPRSIRISRPSVPEHVEHAVERSLAKLPADRYATGRAFVDALEGRTNSTAVHVASSARYPGARGRRGRDLLVIGLAGAVVALGAYAVRETAVARSATRTDVLQFELPTSAAEGLDPNHLRLSADGRRLAYIAKGDDSVSRIYVRDFRELHAHAIRGTEGGVWPFFSPDGNWVAYFARSQIWKVNLAGDFEPIPLAAGSASTRGGAWISEDTILAALDGHLDIVPANGGASVRIPEDSVPLRLSRWYPLDLGDGEHVVFTYWRGTGPNATLAIVSRKTGRVDSTRLRGMFPIGLSGGRLYFINYLRGISVVRIRNGRFTGEPEVVVAPSGLEPGGATLAPSGTLVYQRTLTTNEIVLRRQGADRVVSPKPDVYASARLSPDGKRVAVELENSGRVDVYVLTIATGALDRLTTEGLQNSRPEWTPDGKVLYQSDRDGPFSLWTQALDGTTAPKKILQFPDRDIWQGIVSPDGRYLAYRTGTLGTADIWYRRLDGDSTERPIANSPVVEQSPAFSPDGRWIAYSSSASGPIEVYVQPFPSLSARYRISRGGRDPTWSSDGRAIYYATNSNVLRASLDVGSEVTMTRIDTVPGANIWKIAGVPSIGPGAGNSFVYLRNTTRPPPPIVVIDWNGGVLRNR